MNSNNETCVQRAIFRFYYKKPSNIKNDKILFTRYSHNTITGPDNVRELKHYYELRLERIAQMMEILLKAHDDWAVTERKDCFQIETTSFDFNKAVCLLSEQGFSNEEYSLEVEYTRKWGVL